MMNNERKSPYFTDAEVRVKIDGFLRQNASIESNLGRDSTDKERIKARVKQDRLFEQIKLLDREFYEIIVVKEDRSD